MQFHLQDKIEQQRKENAAAIPQVARSAQNKTEKGRFYLDGSNTTSADSVVVNDPSSWAPSVSRNLGVYTEYPQTDSSKAGLRFTYLNAEWHYMTQEDIDAIGWTGLVSVGFPAPVNKVWNRSVLVPNTAHGTAFASQMAISNYIGSATETYFDCLGLGDPRGVTRFQITTNSSGVFNGGNPLSITTIRNAELLTELENAGTSSAVIFPSVVDISAEELDAFFTALPPTTKTADINIASSPNKAGADPTIATAKGYTVTA